MRFQTLSGVLTAVAGGDGWYTLDFPTAPLTPIEAPSGLAGVLGAHTALAPFWSARLGGRTSMVGYQASSRGGSVRVELAGERTHLTGPAVTVLDGELYACSSTS